MLHRKDEKEKDREGGRRRSEKERRIRRRLFWTVGERGERGTRKRRRVGSQKSTSEW